MGCLVKQILLSFITYSPRKSSAPSTFTKLPGTSLDFFLIMSYLIGTVGTATQSAYAAANTFQDAFARFRVVENLTGSSLVVGIINEVGSVKDSTAFQEMFKRNGMDYLKLSFSSF